MENQTKTIDIKEIQQKETRNGNVKFTLVTNNGKFNFYKNWKGQESPTYQQFKRGVEVGSSVEIEYTEEEKSFVPTDGSNAGQEIKFTDRTIWKFVGDEHGTPYTNQIPSETPQQGIGNSPVAQEDNQGEEPEIKPEDLPF